MSNDLNPVSIPTEAELLLFLIREELKNYKFFNTLAKVGYDGWQYRSNFSDLILAYCGFTHVPDELLEFYMDLMTEYSEKMDGSREELVKAADMVCRELMGKRGQ